MAFEVVAQGSRARRCMAGDSALYCCRLRARRSTQSLSAWSQLWGFKSPAQGDSFGDSSPQCKGVRVAQLRGLKSPAQRAQPQGFEPPLPAQLRGSSPECRGTALGTQVPSRAVGVSSPQRGGRSFRHSSAQPGGGAERIAFALVALGSTCGCGWQLRFFN